MEKNYRINGFEQIKSFYIWLFNNQDKRITPQHVSLYQFFLNQDNRNNWVEWFVCPFETSMTGSCIGSKKTYYKVLHDLQNWNLIQYKAGKNGLYMPLIKLEILNFSENKFVKRDKKSIGKKQIDVDFFDLYKDPRWQKRRLEIMQRDKFACRNCGNTEKTLNVHHLIYIKDMKPWEYEDKLLITMCEDCHEEEGKSKDILKKFIN